MHIKLGYINKSVSKIKLINKVIKGTIRELQSIISSDKYLRGKKKKKFVTFLYNGKTAEQNMANIVFDYVGIRRTYNN